MWLLLAFIAVPMIEIALFIQVGGVIGLGWTLAIVLLTAILGTWLVRAQGFQAIERIRRSINELNDPTQPLAEGAMILLAGALLLTPGFFTDAVGFSLLMPPVRHVVFGWLRRRMKGSAFVMRSSTSASRPGSPQQGGRVGPDVVDAEFTELDPDKRPTHHPSQWTRH
ncbi:exlusion protein FxsA [Oceanicola sp. 22II-s10i]|uniref:FxsA family protein n=1 Tax=Oceanicola sp. 22II-s10i TaxID=1317116 RepID=UPI000B525C57|nr:FxsA family protein [Oceanicola sp. 22II-s10i]OWU85975.1 exlusion protein FxsA [Oceanicola sp. 22II-s10i]